MARRKKSQRSTKPAAGNPRKKTAGSSSKAAAAPDSGDSAAPGEEELDDARPLARMHVWQFQAVRDVLVVALVLFVFWLGHVMQAVTVPLLAALLLAYICEPLVVRLSRHPRITRSLAVGGILATLGVFVALSLAITIPIVVKQTQQIGSVFRDGQFHTAAQGLRQYVPEQYNETFDSLLRYLPTPPGFEPESRDLTEQSDGPSDQDAADSGGAGDPTNQPDDAQTPGTNDDGEAGADPVGETVTAAVTETQVRDIIRQELARQEPVQIEVASPEETELDLVGLAVSSGKRVLMVLGSLLSVGFVLFIVPFYFFFFSLWFPEIQRFIHSLVPKTTRETVFPLLSKMDAVVAGFVRGRLIICFIMGVLFSIGWGIVGVPYWLVIGLITGAFSVVPYLGGVGVPAAIGLLIFGQVQLPEAEQMAWWGWFLWPTVVFVIVQVIEGYGLTPYIFGKQVKLDPVTLVVAVLAGATLAGVYGMILAIPVAACVKILITDVFMPRYREWARGERADFLPIDRGH